MKVIVIILEWIFGILGLVLMGGCVYFSIKEDPMWAIMWPVMILCGWGMARLLIKLADKY